MFRASSAVAIETGHLYANQRPALLTVASYYERRDLMRRTATQPHVPTTQPVPRVELVPL
jgi:hypothetical protein